MTSLESSNVAKLVLACFAVLMVAEGASTENIYLEGATLSSYKESINGLSTSNTLSTQSESYEYMVMQYREPSKQQYRDWMEDNGIEFISYIPEDSWLVKTNTSKEWITSQKKVERVIPYRSKYRVDPSLRDKADESTGPLNARIKLFESAKKPQEILKEHTNSYYRIKSGVWKVKIKPQNMFELSEKSGVKYIYPEAPEVETKNDDSRALIGANKVQESPYWSLPFSH